MTDNEIISKWRGECRHPYTVKIRYPFIGHKCESCGLESRRMSNGIKYDSSHAAWDEALWDEIGKSLIRQFIQNLRDIAYNVDEGNALFSFYMQHWALVKSTPAQKARALAKAIEDSK